MNDKFLLPVGIDDFQTIITGGYYFVDKSVLIKDIIENGAQVILLPRPRRFGKTLNLSMLSYYFKLDRAEQNADLFKDLAITRADPQYISHQGRYPVVFLSLKDVKDETYDQAYQTIKSLMAKLYVQHDYLLESESLKPSQKQLFQQIIDETATETHVRSSLQRLMACLHQHHRIKPILLLDEYDSPLHMSYLHGYYSAMASFMQVFLGEALKGNLDLHKAVITGILRVAQASIFSGLNNIVVYSILDDEFSSYFGFLEEEVQQIIEKSDKAHTMAEIRDWYNGYQFGNQCVYNPWSIINGFHFKGQLKPYWVNVANNSLIKKLISQAKIDVKLQFESLLQGHAIAQTITETMVFSELMEKEQALWNLLLFSGYLTIATLDASTGRNHATLKIPNREVQYVFEDMVAEWFSTKQLSTKNYDELLQSLVELKIPTFERLLQAYICESGSYFDFNQHTPEQVYHALVLGLVVGLRDQFYIQSNRESGYGRFDVCLFPKKTDRPGILMEFKQTLEPEQLVQTAEQALAQITQRQYDAIFRQQQINRILCLGIAFAAREVKIMAEMLTL